MTTPVYIVLAVLCVIAIFLIVRSIRRSVELRQYRRRNRETQFSGSAVKEDESACKENRYADIIGRLGERHVASYLEDLPCEEYRVYNDLLIRNGKHTTQVDHLIISRYGVFVIETKNVHGKVYGGGNAEFWKQYLPDAGYRRYGITQEHQLRNPIWQNDGHIKTLRQLVFDYDVPVYGIIVFPNNTDINVTAEQPVLNMYNVVPYIEQYRDVVLSTDQMYFYHLRLLKVITTSESARKEHLENVHQNKERRDEAVASGKCPKCGGNLVLRNGKYGEFYGCSNYPKCNYILNK